MPRKRGTPLQWLIYFFARAILFALRSLPLPVARRVAMRAGRVLLRLAPRLHRIGREHLDLAYGDALSDQEKRAILREAMDNLCIMAAELAHGKQIAARGYDHVKLLGAENLDPASGALFVGGHHANWELVASVCGRRLGKLAVVVRPLDFPPMDNLIEEMRMNSGFHPIPKGNAADEMVRMMQDGWIVGSMLDQSPRDHAAPVTFFGQACWGTIAPGLLTARAGVPAHFIAVHREPDFSYVVEVSPPIPLVRTGDALHDLQRNSQICQDLMEAQIRKYPGQWLWFHRRWKSRPRLQQEWETRAAAPQPEASATASPSSPG